MIEDQLLLFFILAQYAALHVRLHVSPGRIVNIGTIGAHRYFHGAAVYNTVKAVMTATTRNMARELRPDCT